MFCFEIGVVGDNTSLLAIHLRVFIGGSSENGCVARSPRLVFNAATLSARTECSPRPPAWPESQELRRAQPNISLAWITNEMPIMQGGELEHYLEAFRRAGLVRIPTMSPADSEMMSPGDTK